MIRIPIISEYKDKGFKDAQKGVKGIEGSFKKLGRTMGVTFGAGVALDFGRQAIEEASRLNESINAVEVTFGKAAEAVFALSENSAETVGLAEADFNEFAIKMGGFATQLETDTMSSAAVVDDMAMRAADFASVMNISVSEAGNIMRSTLAGSSEVIRDYGIDVSAAAVDSGLRRLPDSLIGGLHLCIYAF